MNGTNHDEWRFFVALDFDLSGRPLTPDQYPSVVEGMVGTEFASLVLAQYPLSDYASPGLELGALGTDLIFACPARTADQLLFSQVPALAYEFNDSDAPEPFLPPVSFPYGATHGSELRYLFKLRQHGELNQSQQNLSDIMVRYWTQFAKSGDPNASGMPSWPQYDAATDEFQSLLPSSPMAEFQFARDHKCDFWDKLLGASTQVAAHVANKPRRISRF
jgi:para-nitrobenzyl esterase